jgi:hypothetical protein
MHGSPEASLRLDVATDAGVGIRLLSRLWPAGALPTRRAFVVSGPSDLIALAKLHPSQRK